MTVSRTQNTSQRDQFMLSCAYQEATRKNGLIEFTQTIRGDENDLSGKYSVKTSQLTTLFSETVWREIKTKSGHRKIESVITGVVVEYGNHSSDIDPGAAETILGVLQKHLNILCNDIFAYTQGNWKSEPDYGASALRWRNLRQH